MEKFGQLSAKACPLMLPNLNTDQILPARYLKWPRSKGLGSVLFQDLRLDGNGNEREDFLLNQPSWHGCKILLAGRKLRGGSSPEAPAYSFCEHCFPCIGAPAFRGILAHNPPH